MSNPVLLIFILFLLSIPASGQSVSATMGARSAGLGYASATLSDAWSIFNNIGGLSKIDHPAVCFSYDLNAGLPGANRIAAAFLTTVKSGVAGLSLFRFGDDVYSEQIISGGYSNKLGIASLGAKINYIQYNNTLSGVTNAVSVGFGGIATLTPQLSVGAYITNINQPVLSKKDHEQLPTLLTAGISFVPDQHFLLAIEVEKDLAYRPVLKAGIEYRENKKICFRTGLNLQPNAIFLGVGYCTNPLSIDYALGYSTMLSFDQHVSATYRIEKRPSRNVR